MRGALWRSGISNSEPSSPVNVVRSSSHWPSCQRHPRAGCRLTAAARGGSGPEELLVTLPLVHLRHWKEGQADPEKATQQANYTKLSLLYGKDEFLNELKQVEAKRAMQACATHWPSVALGPKLVNNAVQAHKKAAETMGPNFITPLKNHKELLGTMGSNFIPPLKNNAVQAYKKAVETMGPNFITPLKNHKELLDTMGSNFITPLKNHAVQSHKKAVEAMGPNFITPLKNHAEFSTAILELIVALDQKLVKNAVQAHKKAVEVTGPNRITLLKN